MGRSNCSGSIGMILRRSGTNIWRGKAIAGHKRGYIRRSILKLGKFDCTLLPSLQTLARIKWENLLGWSWSIAYEHSQLLSISEWNFPSYLNSLVFKHLWVLRVVSWDREVHFGTMLYWPHAGGCAISATCQPWASACQVEWSASLRLSQPRRISLQSISAQLQFLSPELWFLGWNDWRNLDVRAWRLVVTGSSWRWPASFHMGDLYSLGELDRSLLQKSTIWSMLPTSEITVSESIF